MCNEWRKTEEVIKYFKRDCVINNKCVKTLNAEILEINPQEIIAINSNFDYPDILFDYKMEKLKNSVLLNGWNNSNIMTFCLLMLPSGQLLVNGGGNHRAVLSKEFKIPKVKAYVSKVVYI